MTTTSTQLRTLCDCGSVDFYVEEAIGHDAEIHEGKLIVTKRDCANEVQLILCVACDAEYPLDEFDHSELF